MNSIYEAITYATKMHEGEYRKKTDIPYIVHPFSAMYSLKDCGIEDQNVLIATLQLCRKIRNSAYKIY